ncbi:54S ribosomal protein L37, mitochondrial-like [Oopsacas minuta]|uniref:Large ribosomal subunit protein mL54 n=1 Tax=Oopsacas minuta TaxID=111878 RepID=A0AAV7JSG3_9METZ|nr:54S ribosomal protein L37, mitochondrial-like [Oopsacas minuta]
MISLFTSSCRSLPRISSPLFLTKLRNILTPSILVFASKKATKDAAPPPEELTMESYKLDPFPEVDLNKVCYGLNFLAEGEEVKLKEPSEYPDWLWTLLDPTPEDPSNPTYARSLRKEANRARQIEIIYDKRWPGWEKYYPSEES